MNMLIVIGMVVIFISAFFIIFSGSAFLGSAFECDVDDGETVCRFSELTPISQLSLAMIAFFIVIDVFTVKILVSNLS